MLRFFSSASGFFLVLAALQWIGHLALLGHERWGLVGAAAGIVGAVGSAPLSPLVAWIFFRSVDAAWFYGLLGLGFVFAALSVVVHARSQRL